MVDIAFLLYDASIFDPGGIHSKSSCTRLVSRFVRQCASYDDTNALKLFYDSCYEYRASCK